MANCKPVRKWRRWWGEGEESLDKCLKYNDCWVFGSQESVGELNRFVEIVVLTNCHWRSRELSNANCPVCKFRHPTCLRVTLSEISEHAQTLRAQCVSINSTSEVVLRRLPLLNADDNLLSEHKRNILTRFIFPLLRLLSETFINRSDAICPRGGWMLRLCLFAFTNKQSLRMKWSLLKLSLSPGSCSVTKRTLVVSEG